MSRATDALAHLTPGSRRRVLTVELSGASTGRESLAVQRHHAVEHCLFAIVGHDLVRAVPALETDRGCPPA